MDTIITYAPLITGIWLIFMGSITKTKGFISGIVFNFIPILLGLLTLFSALKLMGWL